MRIETERLELVMLLPNQLKLWITDLAALENELNMVYMGEPLNGFFLDIVKNQVGITENDSQNYMWHSFLLIIRKEDRVAVGSADFKNVPNDNGEVEIGYGLGKAFEHNGYMTETVKYMCEWAFKQDCVRAVIAETDIDGIGSQRVLERNGFRLYKEAETLWWRLDK